MIDERIRIQENYDMTMETAITVKSCVRCDRFIE